MSSTDAYERYAAEVAAQISREAAGKGLTVAVVESLTGGKIATQLAAAPASSEWFAGGIVAYQSHIKHHLLRVPEGPVVSERAVDAMASAAAHLLRTDVVLAVSGAGGPETQDSQPPGTVWAAVRTAAGGHTRLYQLTGEPIEVLAQTELHALKLLKSVMDSVRK